MSLWLVCIFSKFDKMSKNGITLFRDQKSLIRFHLKIDSFLIFFCFLKPLQATSPEQVTPCEGQSGVWTVTGHKG